MQPNIGLKTEDLKRSADMLKQILADEMLLYIKTLNYHWNVRGCHFGPLHKLFKKQYEKEAIWLDAIAERIRTLGHDAPGTLEEFLKLTTLKETPQERPSEKEMLQKLLQDQEHIIIELRKAVDETAEGFHDMATSDFLTDLLADHEQIAWMTRSHLED